MSDTTLVFQAAYRDWLSNNPSALKEWKEARANDPSIAEIPTFPMPLCISASVLPWFRTILETTSRLLEDLIDAALPHWEDVSKRWPATFRDPRLRELIALEGPQPSFLSARYDSFFWPETGAISLFECNVGDPSGLGWVDQQSLLFEQIGFFRERRLVDAILPIVGSHHKALLQHYHACRSAEGSEAAKATELLGALELAEAAAPSGSARPRIAFACAEGSFVLSDHACMRRLYETRGEAAILADPREFVHRPNQGLFYRDQKIDLLIRDTVDEYILDPFWQETQGIRNALRAGEIVVLNPFRAVLGDWKGWWEDLSDPVFWAKLPSEEAALLQKVIPWTRLVEAKKTTDPQGRDVDLPEYARQNQASLILKPTDGYGGFGIVIGEAVSAALWDAALQEALAKPGSQILQIALPLPVGSLPCLQPGGTVVWNDRFVTLSLWYHRPTLGGFFARASADPVINVHQGGGIFPVAALDDL